jgi:hypothetical protein
VSAVRSSNENGQQVTHVCAIAAEEKRGKEEERQQPQQGGKEEDIFEYALNANAAWAAEKSRQNPTFFTNLAKKQSPSIRSLPFPQWLRQLLLHPHEGD